MDDFHARIRTQEWYHDLSSEQEAEGDAMRASSEKADTTCVTVVLYWQACVGLSVATTERDAVMDPSPGEEEDRDRSPSHAGIMDHSPCFADSMDHSPITAEGKIHLSDDIVRRGQATDCRH